jgi:RES domain-containing protein
MIVYRLARVPYADLSGYGAYKYGARWNSPKHALVYCAKSRGTALTEVLVHAFGDIASQDYVLLEIYIPDEQELYSQVSDLPEDWNSLVPTGVTEFIGNQFTEESEFLGLWVPSVVVHGDWNILLNPLHPAMKEVRIIEQRPFPIDPRLVR